MTKPERRPLQNDLERLLLAADLSTTAVEVLLNLALNPARPADLAYNTRLRAGERVEDGLHALRRRGLVLIADENSDDERITVAPPEALERALGAALGARVQLLVTNARQDGVGGICPNPGLVDMAAQGGLPSLAAPFDERHAVLTPLFSQVEVKLHTVCNLRCLYCFIRRDPKDTLDQAAVEDALGRAAASGFRRLILSGGEPTMRRSLPGIIATARALGFEDVQVLTNGLVFAYRERLEACVTAGMTSMVMHVSSTDPALYRTLTGRDLWPQVEAAWKNLARHPELSVEVISVVNRKTAAGMPETIRRTREWQAQAGFRWFANQIPFVCVYSSSWDNRNDLLLPMEETLGTVREIIAEHGASPWPLLFIGYPPCLLPGHEAHIFDLYATLGRILLPHRERDWSFLDTMFNKPARCLTCRHEPYCVGLSRGYARLFGDDLLSPVRGGA